MDHTIKAYFCQIRTANDLGIVGESKIRTQPFHVKIIDAVAKGVDDD